MCLRAICYLLHGKKQFHHVHSMQWLKIIMNSIHQTLKLGGSYGDVVGHIVVDSVFVRGGGGFSDALRGCFVFWGEGSV